MELTLVTGATGAQGGAVANLLLDRGHPVRALTRTPDSPAAQALRARGAHLAQADYDNPESLRRALDGVANVFAVTTPFGPNTNPAKETRQGIALVDAAGDTDHLVFTSACNANRSTGIPHFDSKQRVEEHLAATGRSHTVLAPAAFIDDKFGEWSLQGLRDGVLALPLPGDTPLHLIAVRDIAKIAVHALEHRPRTRLDLASQALTPNEMAEALTTATGRPIRHHQPPTEQVERHSTDLAAMFRYFTEPGTDVDTAALRAAYPDITWHTYEDHVRTLPWPELLHPTR
ncbi:NmrA/HSCARG family protein [Actinosynnema sp. NPDC020468]|uniref:NmrA/HSCARG family protein n=1 Tax=Actinosynnema sp. NPDC020468 TaxID=3154488 RepID=UPI0033C53B6A